MNNKLLKSAAIGFCLAILMGSSFWGCKPSLDFPNTTAINPDAVWTSEAMIQAYLADIYANSMSGWNFYADNSDEAMTQNPTAMSSYDQGVNITVSGVGISLNYTNIDK